MLNFDLETIHRHRDRHAGRYRAGALALPVWSPTGLSACGGGSSAPVETWLPTERIEELRVRRWPDGT